MRRALEAASFVIAVETIGFAGAALGGLLVPNPWFDDLPKPSGWPPQWIFPTAWSAVNYPCLGFATWCVWRKRFETDMTSQLATFAALIAHNVLFGAVVNRAKRTDVYTLMDALGVVNASASLASYARVDRRAGVALIPFVARSIYTAVLKVRLHQHQAL